MGNYTKKYNIDRDLLVYETDRTKEENSLSQVKKYFEEIWSLPENKEQTNPGTDEEVKKAKEALRIRYAELKETYPQAFTHTEMMLAVDCRQLNGALRDDVERDKEMSRHVYPDGTCEDGAAYQPKELSFWKKIYYGILRVVTILIRHLL